MFYLEYSSTMQTLLMGNFTHHQSFSWVVWCALHVGVIALVVMSIALVLCRKRLQECERELSQLREEMETIEVKMLECVDGDEIPDRIEPKSIVSGEVESRIESHELQGGEEEGGETQGEIIERYVNSSMTSGDRLFLTRLIHYIERNIDRADLTVSRLCDFVGVTPLLLNKKLKSLVGMTAIVFIRTIRLHRAAILLRTARYTVADVTYDVGFSDLRYFRECFKREFGVLPQEYKSHGESARI